MEKFKDKYEILIGFITIVISFSVFKEDFQDIVVNLGFIDFNLSQYFFVIVIGFLLSIYLYTVEGVLSKTKLGNWNGFNYVILIAYTIFVIILFSPFIIGLSYLGNILISSIGKMKKSYQIVSNLITLMISLISLILSVFYSNKVLKSKKEKAIEDLEEEEIRDLDTARKLYTDGYYSQSILEAFKVLEVHLYKMISKKNIRVRRFKFNDLFNGAIKSGIIKEDEVPFIQEIRIMRNTAAHNDIEFNKDQAKKAIDFINRLIERSDYNK